jgi:hypothetical protein
MPGRLALAQHEEMFDVNGDDDRNAKKPAYKR